LSSKPEIKKQGYQQGQHYFYGYPNKGKIKRYLKRIPEVTVFQETKVVGKRDKLVKGHEEIIFM